MWLMSDLDREVVEAVVVAKDGRVGACIDICLEMSSGIRTPTEEPPREQHQSGDNTQKRPSEESEVGERADTTIDLLGLDGEDGVAGINIEDKGHGNRPGTGGHVDLMS